MKSQHAINLTKRDAVAAIGDPIPTSSASKKKITAYFSKTVDDSLEATVSRTVCLDGVPFRTFVTSADLRSLFAAKGHCLPKSANTIRGYVIQYAEKVKKTITKELTEKVEKGQKIN